MTKPTKCPSKCPKCNARMEGGYCGWVMYLCFSELHEDDRGFLQTTECKLRVALRQLRKEKARLDALEKERLLAKVWPNNRHFWRADNPSKSTHETAPTLRQLADKLLKS